LDLAEPREDALDALEVIRRRSRGAQLLITPTAWGEVMNTAFNSANDDDRACAQRALAGMRTWDMEAVELSDMDEVFAESIAGRLLDEGIIPLEERHDARIVAEAAVLGCQLLVSSDGHVLHAERARLAAVLLAHRVEAVAIKSPRDIVREFAGR